MEIRPYEHDRDEQTVLGLLSSSLLWGEDPSFVQTLFRWKHREGPWGPSPAWVAEAGGTVVGFRAFLRWRFIGVTGTIDAVRAVDTATATSHRGKGIFTRLTLHGIEAFIEQGVGFVFNTPNDQSRPGYLKMGWEVAGPMAARIRLVDPTAVPRILRARTEAELRPRTTQRGRDVSAVLDECHPPLPPRGIALKTDRSDAYLRWRFGHSFLGYRAIVQDGGVAFFRLRRRGSATEAVIGDVLADTATARRRLVEAVARECRADYMLALGPACDTPGTMPLPWQGPTLTWRALAVTQRPPLALSMGDVEFF